jgi:trans-aconitate methyltransferase
MEPVRQDIIGGEAASVQASLPRSLIENSGTTFDPEAYAALNALVQKGGWERVIATVGEIPTNARILDLGCGHGGNAAELARSLRNSGGVVFGIEASEAMVQKAREKYTPQTAPNLTFIHGRAEEAAEAIRELFTPGGSTQPTFDVILSNYTLHWVRDPATPSRFLHEEMFSGLNRLQKIGDRQCHFCAECDAFKELFEAGYALIRGSDEWRGYFAPQSGDHTEDGEWRHPPLISSADLSDALERSGYKGTVERVEEERVFDSRSSLEGWVGAMIRPFMNKIPEQKKGSFVKAWIDHYLASCDWATRRAATGSDVFILRDRNLLVTASKLAELE